MSYTESLTNRRTAPVRRRASSRHPALLRFMSLATTLVFAWTFILSAPARAFANQPGRKHYGVRKLTLSQMTKIVGSQYVPFPGTAYPWQRTYKGVNTYNGNKLTPIPIV